MPTRPPIIHGGIYRIHASPPQHLSALVLLTRSITPQIHAVTLLSPDIEFCTNLDLLVATTETGLSYPVLIAGDIFGYIFTDQIDQRLGQVSEGILSALAALHNDETLTQPIAGPPLTTNTDPRWAFKLRELKRLQAITNSCTHHLLES